jgi:tetrapyrrole methylase family protein / MazG family protein
VARLVWIGSGTGSGCPPEAREALAAAPIVFHPDPEHPSFVALQESGVKVRALVHGDLPDDAVLALPGGPDLPSSPLEELVLTVDRLLGPGGCPWDQAQTHETLKKHLVEETYEVLDAIDSGSLARLHEELGDLLLQPVMHGQISRAAGGFDTQDVAREIVEKLVRRHPHVFGEVDVADADEVLRNWDRIKQEERDGAPESILAGVPKAMPALLRALEVSKRAARVGFEWPDVEDVFKKLREEEAELREAIAEGTPAKIEAEVGDLLFTAVNLARWAGVEPEEALRKMLDRFTARFVEMERVAGKPLRELSFQEWDQLWEDAKSSQTHPSDPPDPTHPKQS